MNEPIVEVIGLAHGEFVKNGVTVRTELGDSLPPIQGDRVQLQQAMLNLVISAIQAMSDVRDSKSIIEDHRGRLWASRIEPQGALFHEPSYSAGHIIIRSVSLFGTNRRLEDV
jgi:C4-dicarboxylate-specific signal transduction histidine kinase